MNAVLDASALLAYLQDEAGAGTVEAVLPDSAMSSVNWAEVVQKSVAGGVDASGLREDLEALGLNVSPFTAEEAETTARLWRSTRPYGLSLGDRACLSLGLHLDVPVFTTDRAWLKLKLALEVRMAR